MRTAAVSSVGFWRLTSFKRRSIPRELGQRQQEVSFPQQAATQTPCLFNNVDAQSGHCLSTKPHKLSRSSDLLNVVVRAKPGFCLPVKAQPSPQLSAAEVRLFCDGFWADCQSRQTNREVATGGCWVLTSYTSQGQDGCGGLV
ncbi:TPA: hypothetical protein ACH3X3_010711 [Trebouxia sp. C0006]